MKKRTKIIIVVTAIVVAIAVIIGLGYYYWVKTEYKPENPDLDLPTVSGNNMSDIEITDSEEKNTYDTVDRTPHFDVVAPLKKRDVIQFTEDMSEEEIEEINNEIKELFFTNDGVYFFTGSDDVGTILVQPSTNITPIDSYNYYQECLGVDGTEIDIHQYSSEYTVEDAWEVYMHRYAFEAYMGLRERDLTGDEEYVLGQGMVDYTNYFGVPYDPTMKDDVQLIVDRGISTIFGDGKLLIIYQINQRRFLGYGIIDAGDRVLCVDIVTNNIDYVEPYIQEACSGVITIFR